MQLDERRRRWLVSGIVAIALVRRHNRRGSVRDIQPVQGEREGAQGATACRKVGRKLNPAWVTAAVAALALLGVLLYGVVYVYQLSFYSQFGVTPDEVGLTKVDTIARVAVYTVILSSVFLALVGVTALMLARARSLPLRRSVAFAIVDYAIIATLILILSRVFRPTLNFRTFSYAIILTPGLVLFWLGLKDYLKWLWRWLLPYVGSIAVVGLAVSPWLLWNLGQQDAIRVKGKGLAEEYVSEWQNMAGARASPVDVFWTSPQVTPLRRPVKQGDLSRLLGEVGGVVIVYDLEDCTLKRLAAASVVLSAEIGHPEGQKPNQVPSVLPVCEPD